MVDGVAQLLPTARVGHIGVSRDEETFRPKPYVNKLPERLEGRQVIVLEAAMLSSPPRPLLNIVASHWVPTSVVGCTAE